ncbi:protein tyrosine/serine phosphatase [Swaminathania salitolerans LMG 21291]|uniref:Tyrosine phosphatase n=2 Tax=Swaminathania salitolerans TaxID=182838 RepID=A0A511BRK6_9PROT|nr:protein tyrosine/serine phosphatase [Swaminathania salitolerans LMG 21291]GEL02473.1 tyrosine phosphatase [Swaminathania salitolerans]
MTPEYRLHWPDGLGRVDIYAALRPDRDGMRLMQRGLSGGTASLASPFPEQDRVYFFIKPQNGQDGLWLADRVLTLEGVANFRDMGGYETQDHRHVRWGQLYRSAAPSGLTSQDYAQIDALGIRTVTDLRTEAEQRKQPTHWKTGPNGTPPAFFASKKPVLPGQMTDRAQLARLDTRQARAMMAGFYSRMPELYEDELKGIFARLLAHRTPTLTHCTAGKDRTGFASALVLYALGVPEKTILADYAMSGTLLRAHMTPSFKAAMNDPKTGGAATAASPAMQAMLDSDPAYLEAGFRAIRERYGSVDRYLSEKLGVGPQQRAQLQSLYLD